MAGGNKTLENLNKGQREAVEHGDGPLLVIAGAGTGRVPWAHLTVPPPTFSGEHIH